MYIFKCCKSFSMSMFTSIEANNNVDGSSSKDGNSKRAGIHPSCGRVEVT